MSEYGGHLEGSIEAKYKYALKMIDKNIMPEGVIKS